MKAFPAIDAVQRCFVVDFTVSLNHVSQAGEQRHLFWACTYSKSYYAADRLTAFLKGLDLLASPKHDFTQGNLLKQLVTFSIPLVIANLLQASFQIVDSLWIGNLLGAQMLGAVAVSSVIIFTTLSFVIGMNNAALAILSQQAGRKNTDGLRRYLNAFVVIMFAMAAVLGVLGFLLSPRILALMGTPESILAPATHYLQINFLGILFLFGYNFISTVLRAMGDSKTPLRFVAVAVVLHIFLDPLFIHVFGLGIRGAAFATVTSQGAAFLFGLTYVLRKSLAPFEWPRLPTWEEIRTVLSVGIPSGLQMAVISAGSAAIMSVVASFGAEVVGGYGAAQRIDSLLMLPAQAFSIAASAMAGQNIGRGNWDRVAKVSRVTVLFNAAVMVSLALIIFLFGGNMIRLFVDDAQAVEFGSRYLRLVAFCYPFLGINFVLNGIVRASGSMVPVLILNIISFWVLRYPLTSTFARMLGEDGIAIGIGTSFIISSAFAYLYFRFGRWRQKQLFDSAPESHADKS